MITRSAVSTFLAFSLLLNLCSVALASSESMRGPAAKRQRPAGRDETEASFLRLALFGTLKLYQRYVSPIDGDRCGFSPSCSAFARWAVERSGVGEGILATADRLMRCTVFKGQGQDYLPLPDGRLFDPVENNLRSSP